MRIAIDIHPLNWKEKAGFYRYIYNLVSHLLSMDSSNDYTLFNSFRGFYGDKNIDRKFIYRFSGRLSVLLLETLSFPVELIMGPVDLFHGPCFFVPSCLRCKSIVTIHDLMPFRHPEFSEAKWIVHFKKNIDLSIRRADAIISGSNATKVDLMEYLDVPEEKIVVIYHGVSPAFRPVTDRAHIEEIKAKYGIGGQPYLLFVGNIEPKKNIETLIHAYVQLRNETIYQFPLLIVGKKSEHFYKVWEVVKKLHVEKEVLFTDGVNDDELPSLYSGAELFVFPSLFEGFGIPVIEAMACGTPVVASHRASIPEVAKDAALFVDPLNRDEIAGAMYQILQNSTLKDQLVEKGLSHSKKFTWEKTARETLKLYERIGHQMRGAHTH